jgi:hypothetical protein
MRGRTSLSCSAPLLVMFGLGGTPAAACPWNGCGTDAYNAARAYAYYAPPLEAYAPPAYGYYATSSMYYAPAADAPQVYGYSPAAYYGRRNYTRGPYYYSGRVGRVGWRR